MATGPANGRINFITTFQRGNGPPSAPGRIVAVIANNRITFTIKDNPAYPDISSNCNYVASQISSKGFFNIFFADATLTYQYRITSCSYSSECWTLYMVSTPGMTLPSFYTGDTVRLYSTNISSAATEGAVCFAEGTKILCEGGPIPIEHLRIGMKVKTRKHGYKRITLIGKGSIYNSGDSERTRERLYIYPKSGLRLTGGHSVLIEDANSEQLSIIRASFGRIYITEGCFRLMAKDDPAAKPYSVPGIFPIYNFALEEEGEHQNYGVSADGVLVESSFEYWIRKAMQIV